MKISPNSPYQSNKQNPPSFKGVTIFTGPVDKLRVLNEGLEILSQESKFIELFKYLKFNLLDSLTNKEGISKLLITFPDNIKLFNSQKFFDMLRELETKLNLKSQTLQSFRSVNSQT